MWTSSDVNGGSWGDIIPPNNNNQDSKNWTTAGQAIYKGQVFVASTGLPACRGMTLKAYVDALRDANVSDADIVADLNEADADEDKAILSKAGQSTFTTSNLTTVANASQSISATTSAATSISTSGATLNGSFKTDATSVSWYFEYNQGDSTFADAPSETTCTSLGATNTTLSRSASISSLTSNRKYFFRAVIVDSCGASPSILLYGEVYSFTTSSTVYRVTYNENGGTGAVPTDPNVYIANEKAYVYGNTGGLTKSGAVFKHWATSPSGSALRAGTPPSLTLKSSPDIKVFGGSSSNWAFLKVRPRVTEFYTYGSGSELTVTSDTTLYAIYETAYTVTYNGNTNSGGSAPTDSNSYANGATVTVLGNTGTLTKDGYTFANWCTTQPAAGSTCTGTTQAASSPFTMGTSNVNLYAIWTANTLTITYNSQGGTSISSGTTTTGGSISTSPGSPTRNGYIFNGWFAASSGGTAITFPYAHGQTSNFTLYAQWTPRTYTLTYDGNSPDSGTPPAQQTYTTGSTAITIQGNSQTPPLAKTGFNFTGWFSNSAGTGGTSYTPGNTLTLSDTTTIYAKWVAVGSNTVTFNKNDSSGPQTLKAPLRPLRLLQAARFDLERATHLVAGQRNRMEQEFHMLKVRIIHSRPALIYTRNGLRILTP